MNKFLLITGLASALAFGCAGDGEEASAPANAPSRKSAAASKPASGGGAGVSGTITFTGSVPEAQSIQMAADPSCARMHPDAPKTQRVVVGNNGGLKNVFVYVKEGLQGQIFDIPEETALLDQKGCLYAPHVFGVRAGQTLTIVNNDETLHNIHAMPKNNKEFNIGQPIKGLKTSKVFNNPEVMVPFKCDVHKWMASYVGVVDHPFFAVTDSDGRFSIEALPEGDYVVEVWHEKYGTKQADLSVGADGAAALDFEFSE